MTLRSVTVDHGKIEERLESVKVNGFINYFGLQRFGTTSVPTHEIGMFLFVQSNHFETTMCLLQCWPIS